LPIRASFDLLKPRSGASGVAEAMAPEHQNPYRISAAKAPVRWPMGAGGTPHPCPWL